jgi:hypothetical protein
MRYKGAGAGVNATSRGSTIRLERMATAIDEIIEAFTILAELDGWEETQQRLKLAAAGRRLWLMASSVSRPGNG